MWGPGVRVFDKETGEVVWETELPTGVTGGPLSYELDGKQHIVVAIGGWGVEPNWVAVRWSCALVVDAFAGCGTSSTSMTFARS
mgnify:CR=1 FL=1